MSLFLCHSLFLSYDKSVPISSLSDCSSVVLDVSAFILTPYKFGFFVSC